MIQDSAYARWLEGRRNLIALATAFLAGTGGLILDVAGGNSAYSQLVAEITGGALVTHDYSLAECLAAYARGSASVRGDALSLPFASAVADVTVAFEIIEHFDEQQATALVDEMWRVTKPGGYVLLSTPNRRSLESLKGLYTYMRHGTVWNARDNTHVLLYTPGRLRAGLARRFDVLKTFGYYLVPEVRGRTTPLTHRITTNPLLTPLAHKLLVVAQRPA